MLSLTAEYALRAVLYIAHQNGGSRVRVDVLADALDLPRNYLSKTLNQLSKEGVLESHRGPSGGFRLARPAEELTLAKVVHPFDPDTGRLTCLLGRSHCDDAHPCPAHARWVPLGERLARFFRETTVAQLLQDYDFNGDLAEALRGRREARTARLPVAEAAPDPAAPRNGSHNGAVARPRHSPIVIRPA